MIRGVSARHYLRSLRRWWWLPLVGTLLSTLISFTVARQLPPVYEAGTTLLVNYSAPGTPLTYNDALLSQQLVKTYAEMAIQPVVLDQVRSDLALDTPVDRLAHQLSVSPVQNTQLFSISARAADPMTARDIADDTARVFMLQQQQLFPDSATSSAIRVVQPALLPVTPVEPRVLVYVVMSALLVLLLTLGAVYQLARMDDTFVLPDEAERLSSLTTLAVIPDLQHPAADCPSSVEAYRVLRTAIHFAAAGQRVRTLLVTSPGRGEGKSTVAANLAMAFARVGERVVIVDADLRRPSLHERFGLSNDQGLASLLTRAAATGSIETGFELRQGPLGNLQVLTAGPPVSGAMELLHSRFSAILGQLARQADVVVVDSPPVLPLADALVLAEYVDAAVLVIQADATRQTAVRQASGALAQSGTRVLGTILNRARSGSAADPHPTRLQSARHASRTLADRGRRVLGVVIAKAPDGWARASAAQALAVRQASARLNQTRTRLLVPAISRARRLWESWRGAFGYDRLGQVDAQVDADATQRTA